MPVLKYWDPDAAGGAGDWVSIIGDEHNHDTRYVNVDGDTMTGKLTLDAGLRVTPVIDVEAGDVLTAINSSGDVDFAPVSSVIADLVSDPVLINWFGADQGIAPWEAVSGTGTVTWYDDVSSPTVPGVMRMYIPDAGGVLMAEWRGSSPLPYGLDDLYRIRVRGQGNASLIDGGGTIEVGFVCYGADRATVVDRNNTSALIDAHAAINGYQIPAESVAVYTDIPENGAAYISGRADSGGALRIPTTAITNLVPAEDSSFEGGTVGSWTTGGTLPPTITNSTTHAAVGTKALQVAWANGGTLPLIQLSITGLVVGREYKISAKVWVPAGDPDVCWLVDGVFSSPSSGNGAFVTIEHTFVASSATTAVQLWPVTSPVTGDLVWVDDVQLHLTSDTQTWADWDEAVVVAADVRYWRPYVKVTAGSNAGSVFDVDSIEIYRLDASVRVPSGVIATSVTTDEAIIDQAIISTLALTPDPDEIAAGGPIGWVWTSRDAVGVGGWSPTKPPVTVSPTAPTDPAVGDTWDDSTLLDVEEFTWTIVGSSISTTTAPGTQNGTFQDMGWPVISVDVPCDGLVWMEWMGLLKTTVANTGVAYAILYRQASEGVTVSSRWDASGIAGAARIAGGTSTSEFGAMGANVWQVTGVPAGGATLEFYNAVAMSAAASGGVRIPTIRGRFIPFGAERHSHMSW